MSSNGNAAAYFVDRHIIEDRSDKVAFVEAGPDGHSMTYGRLAELSGRVATALTRADFRREERAVMLVLDQLEFPQIFWGCLKSGVIPIPLNTLLATSVYEAILEDCRASILFVSDALLPAVGPAIAANTHLRKVVVIGENTDGHDAYADFIDGCAASETVPASADETAFWLYSSGSTGLPKGVKHVHGSLRATCDTYGAQVLGIQENDRIYSAAKLFFAYGLGNGMSFPMSVGATAILNAGRPTPDGVLDILETHSPTIFGGVPTLYAAMLAQMENTGYEPTAKLRVSISAGEALPADIGLKWKAAWGSDILDGVGSTEMLHIFLSNRSDDLLYGTSGVAVPGYDLRLVDEDGTDVAVGGIGELLVRGDSAADGYWNQRAKSRTTFEGEWTRTGDKYELSDDGRYIYCGRTDDMFKVSGIWVSPFEVEQALIAHPAVLESAVVAHRDKDGLEKPKAYVVLKEGATVTGLADALREHVKVAVGKWKYPRWVEFVDDLPKTATGKIQRFKLRDGD